MLKHAAGFFTLCPLVIKIKVDIFMGGLIPSRMSFPAEG